MADNRTAAEINAHINARYDRITMLLPKGTKDMVEMYARDRWYNNLSAYIRGLIEADISGSVDWKRYRDHEDYGVLLRMAENQRTQPITDYRRQLR